MRAPARDRSAVRLTRSARDHDDARTGLRTFTEEPEPRGPDGAEPEENVATSFSRKSS